MLDSIIGFIEQYGLIAICLAIFLEYACFPVPSEVILPLAGAISFQNNINFFIVIILSIICGLMGAFLCYLIGYIGGFPIIEKIKKRFPKTKKNFDSSDSKYKGLSITSICFGRLVPICRTYISFIAGAYRMNTSKYLFFTFIGISIWNLALISLGRFFYGNLSVVNQIYTKYKFFILISIFSIILLVFIKKILKMSKNKRKRAQ